MRLRAYEKEDSPIIATWLRTEKELYQWSADRYGFFPLKPYSIDDNYFFSTSRRFMSSMF